jgi:hypothetical protein
MGCVVLGAIVVTISVREFSGEVRVVLAGVSAQDSTLVSFVISNTFRKPVVYFFEGQLDTSGVWQKSTFYYTNYTGKIMGQSAEIVAVRVRSPKRWRFIVLYGSSWRTPAQGSRASPLAGIGNASANGWRRHRASAARLVQK